MSGGGQQLTLRERKNLRRLQSRGEGELFNCLIQLRGLRLRERFNLGELYAIGGEGAIFRVHDSRHPEDKLVAKIALAPWHRPARLTSGKLRRAREVILHEARVLTVSESPFLPHCEGLQQFDNPLLEKERGGQFAKPEPCLVMEYIPGCDLDTWLCRVHRGAFDMESLRPTFDRIAVGILQALADLEQRGYLYADLRPGNLRVVGRPERRVRMLDAGGCVRVDDDERRFPHVPSYLPPRLFWAAENGEALVPTPAVQAAMAGRTLYEIATGKTPEAARAIDLGALRRSAVSPAVADVIRKLSREAFPNCAMAVETLARAASRRVSSG